MPKQRFSFSPNRRQLALVALAVIALYVLLPQLGDFRSSWHLVSHPKPGPAALAVGFTFATYLAAAATYCFLAFHRLRFWRTTGVELAAMFINRLLPIGIGALGANYLYLRHERHKEASAAAVVAVNNLLGFVGHGTLVTMTLLLSSGQAWRLPASSGSGLEAITVVKIAGAVGLLLLTLGLILGRRKLFTMLNDVKAQVLGYRHRSWKLLGALCTSMILTLCNVLSLFFCLHALGLQLPFPAVLLVFTLGVGAGSAVPTPGGLGGFEAGLAAGFVAYGLDASSALAVALLYRLISYWLPLAVGALALVWCQRERLLEVS